MSTVRYFRHDDPGAPALTGQVGSLTNLLRKCLVGTAGVAYGSKASAGWTEEFAGTAGNIAVFKNNEAAGGCGCCLRVLDNAPGPAGARESSLNIYAGMTDVNTGTLGSATTYFRKSSELSAAARPWLLVADERTAWVMSWGIGDPGVNSQGTSVLGFGDYGAFVPPANTNRYFIIAREGQNSYNGGQQKAFRADQTRSIAAQAASPAGAGMVNTAFLPYFGSGVVFGGGGAPALLSGGDVLLARDALVVGPSNLQLGVHRGLLLPFCRVDSLSPGGSIGGSSVVVLAGNVSGTASANEEFRVGIDTQGPW